MGQFVPRSFSFPLSRLLGFIPRRRLLHGMAGRCPSRVHRTAALRRLALYGRPRLCYSRGRDGGISSRAAPFPMNGKGRGDRVEHNETEVFYEKTPCLYYRRMVRRGLQKHGTGGPVLSGGVFLLFAPRCICPCSSTMRFPRSIRAAST